MEIEERDAKMKKSLVLWMSIGLVMLATAGPLLAQSETLTLRVNKVMGFDLGSQIQGTFKVSVQGPASLQRVVFKLDGTPLGEDDTPPFEVRFKTDAYAPGWHTLSAEGYLATGTVLYAAESRFQFVTGQEAGKAMQRILLPVMVLVVVSMMLGTLLTFLGGREQSGEFPAHYGFWGGAICPVCHRPYARHWWGVNLGPLGRFERCPHCGSWRVTHRASQQELEEAARLWQTREENPPIPPAPPDWEQTVEDSRYTRLE